jgi:hypothetical protein
MMTTFGQSLGSSVPVAPEFVVQKCKLLLKKGDEI